MINRFLILINNILSKEMFDSSVISLLFQENFGGEIYCIKEEDIEHYFNILDNKIYDIKNNCFLYHSKELLDRNDILSSKDILNKYNSLKEKYEQECAKVLKINSDVYNCSKCGNYVEKFSTDRTIHFGKNKDIIILGEAPANNGWRKSGKVWYDVEGNLLPSGKVMQKLLDEIDFKLLDITFLEAIKCYPKNRKYLNVCKNNCVDILNRQIEILNPKIILTLGDMATKTILDIKYSKFSEVVGKCYKKEINGNIIKIIPIYHPSPISPMSYKGNLPIFRKLKELC